MNATKQFRWLTINGALLILAIVLFMLILTLATLADQQRLTRSINAHWHARERSRDLSRSIGQFDLVRARYRSTGLLIFRLGCEQLTDSIQSQLQELRRYGHEPYTTISQAVDSLQRYGNVAVRHGDSKMESRIALEEEKQFDVIRSALHDRDETLEATIRQLQRRQQAQLDQCRNWVLPAAVFALIVWAVVTVLALTRIRLPNDKRHGRSA